jgi:hypothetical protein
LAGCLPCDSGLRRNRRHIESPPPAPPAYARRTALPPRWSRSCPGPPSCRRAAPAPYRAWIGRVGRGTRRSYGTRFFNPPFHSLAEARASRRVRPRRDTSVGVWSRRPQLLRSFCSLHSGYSGRVKDSSSASGLDVRMTSADSALSSYPSRRMDQFFPKPRGEGVRPTATLIAIHSQSRLPLGHSPGCSQPQPHPPCGGCNSTSAWSTTTEVPAKLKSSFLARGWC